MFFFIGIIAVILLCAVVGLLIGRLDVMLIELIFAALSFEALRIFARARNRGEWFNDKLQVGPLFIAICTGPDGWPLAFIVAWGKRKLISWENWKK